MSKLFDPGFYTEVDLKDAGFKAIGKNVLIEKKLHHSGHRKY